MTNKQRRREDVGRQYVSGAATLYRLTSKRRFTTQSGPGRAPCAGPRHEITTTVSLKRQSAPADTETIAVIECLEGVVFVFSGAFIADIGPWCDGVDLRVRIINPAVPAAIACIGNNLNQLARAANRQQWPGEIDLLCQLIDIERFIGNRVPSHDD